MNVDAYGVWLQWSGCLLGVLGSMLLALRTRISGWGFVAYLVSNVAWLCFALATGLTALAVQHLVYSGISGFGVWRWLVRPRLLPKDGGPARSVDA